MNSKKKNPPRFVTLFVFLYISMQPAYTMPLSSNGSYGNKAPQDEVINTETDTQIQSTDETGEIPKEPEEDQKESKESSFFPAVNQIFNNPILSRNLKAGTQLINNSVESLMEGIFYKLLDNEFRQNITSNFWFSEALNRSVFSTSQGKYVIVDRFSFGPRYEKELFKFFRIPGLLGLDTSLEILDIYVRNDAQRIEEKTSLPAWRSSLNNWFGLLPSLERILPPSFNPNNLYDPLRQLNTPFSFPVNVESFDVMPEGSIRSYAIQGGIHIPFSIDALKSLHIEDLLQKFNLSGALPYTIFVEGEYRINVLKKSNNIAWVGLSNFNVKGNSIAGFIGSTFYILKNSLKPIPWDGVPSPFAPVDAQAIKSFINRFDQLYEFDLSEASGKKFYEDAIQGDFTKLGKSKEAGYQFHFTKNTISEKKFKKNSKNLVLLYRENFETELTQSEIKITDEKGGFFILEDIHRFKEERWNILSGSKEEELTSQIELNVEKIRVKESPMDAPEFVYSFNKGISPYYVVLQYEIKNRFTNMEEFYTYVDKIKNFTRLDLLDIPDVPLIDSKVLENKRLKTYFLSPADSAIDIHVVSSPLGKFSASASSYFNYEHIKQILAKTDYEKRQALFKAFFPSSSFDDESDNFFIQHGSKLKDWVIRLSVYPLRFFNIKFPKFDAFFEIDTKLSALEKLAETAEPKEILNHFYDLFDTDYPELILSALYNLSDLPKIPRKVSFYVSPDSSLSDESKEKFHRLNNKTFASDVDFPSPERYEVTAQKLNAFSPTNLKEEKGIPELLSLNIQHYPNVNTMRVSVNNNSTPNLKFYIKFETASEFLLSNSVLAQTVTTLEPSEISGNVKDKTHSYNFTITGDQTPWIEPIDVTSFSEEKDYMLNIATSYDGLSWSETRSIKLKYKRGLFFEK